MPWMQLERLRRDAMNQGVLPRLVYPQHRNGNSRSAPEFWSKCQCVASVTNRSAVHLALPKFTLRARKTATKIEIIVTEAVETEITIRPVPHPRPRYIYGDLYAPEYQASLKMEDRPKFCKQNRSRMSVRDAGHMCKYCAVNAGWPCVRLTPCMAGVNLAREVLVSRALMEMSRTRRGRVRPKPSPLRISFAAGSQGSQSSLHGSGALNDPIISDRASASSFQDLEEDIESILENAEFLRGNSSRLFSACFDGLDRVTLSISSGDAAELDSTSDEGDSDDCSSTENFCGAENELDGRRWDGKRITFSELPSIKHKHLTRQAVHVKASKLSRATISRCNHLRYARSAFFKRNSRSFS